MAKNSLEVILLGIDEVSLQRWMKESQTAFKVYQERYEDTGSRQDKFDLLVKYMEIAVLQAKKNSFNRDT
jgi:hypothetical protein